MNSLFIGFENDEWCRVPDVTGLYLINNYLFFRCLEKVFKEGRKENKKGNSRGVTTT